MKEVNQVLQRRVTIWENLNANDYDQRRLCLGPFSGRSTNICSHLNGMLINPNCEFELNFIPLNTLGQWFQSFAQQSGENDYQVNEALHRAIEQWLPLFNQVDQFFLCKSSFSIFFLVNSKNKSSMIEYDDVKLLIDLFYLPYQNGVTAQKLLNDFYWLRFYCDLPEKVLRSRFLNLF